MKLLHIVPYIIFLCLLSACGDRPENLVGKWEWKRDECLTSETEEIFKNTNKEDKYILEFHDAQNMSLEYPERKIVLRDGNSKNCDILLKGTYSYTIFGKIRFNFKDDSENYRVVTSAGCGISKESNNSQLSAAISPGSNVGSPQSGNRDLPYLTGESMSIRQMDMDTLRLIIPGFPGCKGDKSKAYFERIKPES